MVLAQKGMQMPAMTPAAQQAHSTPRVARLSGGLHLCALHGWEGVWPVAGGCAAAAAGAPRDQAP